MNGIKDLILNIQLRADKWDEESLVKTFVKVGPIMVVLGNENNQVLFGRRGTGKTHILKYLKSQKENVGDCCIYIDLRKIGSSDSIYNDTTLPIEQRGLRLFIDIIKVIQDEIIRYITSDKSKKEKYLHIVTPIVELFNTTWTKQHLTGNVTGERIDKTSELNNFGSNFSIGKSMGLAFNNEENNTAEQSSSIKVVGAYSTHINLMEASQLLQQILDTIYPHKIWLELDEFSELSTEMQIVLSDILRRVISPVKGITFKIAAIEHRTSFNQRYNTADYFGLELGADVSTINLDEIMVFGNNHAQSLSFFRQLLTLRVQANSELQQDSNQVIDELFASEKGFEELVLAAEGVPRDFFNILNKAIIANYYSKISVPIIRKAARDWFSEDKRSSIQAYPQANMLLDWIISDVINTRQARAFMLRSDNADELIDGLYDARILHIIKQNVSSRDTPGVRYNVYSIDYGCYVELINTTRAPKGLFEDETDDGHTQFINVPRDDYRSIRRTILDLSKFYSSTKL